MSKLFRKISASFLAVIMFLFGAGIFNSAFVSTAAAAEQTALTGDINADGAVNSSDALCALMYCVNLYKIESKNFSVADVNGNNIVNSYDAVGILELSTGEIDSFSEWNPFEGNGKTAFSLNLSNETDYMAIVVIELNEGGFRNGTFKLNLHNPDLSCTNIFESTSLSGICDSMEASGELSAYSSNIDNASVAFAGSFDITESIECFRFYIKKESTASITAADISLSVFDSGAKVVNNLPASSSMPDIPTFSMNILSENNTSAVVSVKHESGAFRYGTFKLNFADSFFACTNLTKGDAFIQNSSKIEDDGGTVTFAGNKDYAMASLAGNMDLTYTGDYLLFTVSKSSSDKIIPDDMSLTIYDIEANVINNIPEPVVVVQGEVGDNLTWVLNLVDKTLTVNCEGTMPPFSDSEAPWAEYYSYIETVTVTGACKNVSSYAFAECENIKSIKLPSSVAMVSSNAFSNCTSLEDIIFLNNNVMLLSNSLFSDCEDVTIWCFENSKADAFAQKNDLRAEYIKIILSESNLLLADGESVKLDAEYNTKLLDSENISLSTVSGGINIDNGIVTALDFCEAQIKASDSNGCTAYCSVKVDIRLIDGAEATISDGFISGNDIFAKSADDIVNLFMNRNVTVNTDKNVVGTGDTVTVLNASGGVYKTLTVVIYGDTNSDGIYDATDAVIVSCIADGMLTEAQAGRAVYMAADCNHDGTIDEFDAGLLEKAGLLLESVTQGKTAEELKTDSVYMQYLSLIDQSVDEQIIEEPESSNSFVQIIIKIITAIVLYFKSIFI